MALVIEDGTGVTGANTYASAAELVAYAAGRGVTLTATAAEPLLLAAMDRMAGLEYLGCRATRDQALDFPRSGVCIDGFSYASTELPAQLKQAQLAYALAARSVELLPVAAAGASGAVIEETVGPLTTKYAAPKQDQVRARVPVADALLAKLLRAGAGNTIRVLRA